MDALSNTDLRTHVWICENLFKLYYVCHITNKLRLLREKLEAAMSIFQFRV